MPVVVPAARSMRHKREHVPESKQEAAGSERTVTTVLTFYYTYYAGPWKVLLKTPAAPVGLARCAQTSCSEMGCWRLCISGNWFSNGGLQTCLIQFLGSFSYIPHRCVFFHKHLLVFVVYMWFWTGLYLKWVSDKSLRVNFLKFFVFYVFLSSTNQKYLVNIMQMCIWKS